MVLNEEVILYPEDMPGPLESLFKNGSGLICSDQIPIWDSLQQFYALRKYKPLFWKALTNDSTAEEWHAIESDFSLAESHGMDKRYYHLPLIAYYRSILGSITSQDSAYALLAELDVLLAHAYARMYSDIALGRTDPRELYGYTYMLPGNTGVECDWEGFLRNGHKARLIDALHREDTTYQRLLDLLADERMKLASDMQQIDFAGYPKISPGDTVPILPAILRRLKAIEEPDSSIHEVEEDTIYGNQLVELIKRIQEKNNLAADGVMGYKTYRVINANSASRIDQIRANLERERWFKRPPYEDAPFIYVNLPSYMVYLYYPDSVKSMKVCIGKNLPDNYDALVMRYTDSGWLHRLPKDMETPQISARVSQIILNPTWTVPRSIIKNEMYWKMRRDPDYLEDNNYVVYDGDSLLDSRSVDWSRFKPDKVPYRIVQTPGPHNALGKVKYVFWNAFDIFMHDTPLKSKFELPQRAVSHGCVRLEDPLLFGEFVIQNSKQYDRDDFRIMMGYPPLDEERLEAYDPLDSTADVQAIDSTFRIRLFKSIPIYMDYRTISFDQEGKPHFHYDIYDRNKYILRKMEE